eukprot:CAMPEP_0175142916 /NCGR_PEP_ID=MMETSP0087-20121206/13101_1 /TAXON_ID=136419 /ORGANISM="Unknown Unknown, Strain D1" /LENGTH=408 /DNA_ID=CAMNT_0016426845 /DNA_START=6 /DNA_END=1235 /DNA_ORIENTATION=-
MGEQDDKENKPVAVQEDRQPAVEVQEESDPTSDSLGQKKKKKKNNRKKKSASAVEALSTDAKLDAEPSALSADVKALLNTKIATIETAGNKTTFDPKDVDTTQQAKDAEEKLAKLLTGKSLEEQVKLLRTFYLSEVKSKAVTCGEVRFWKGKHTLLKEAHNRNVAVKDKLDEMCKDLHKRNQAYSVELKDIQAIHSKQHKDMTTKFETSLESIGQQLAQHNENSDAVHKENVKMKEQIQKLLEYDKAKEAHQQHQLKTKDIEYKMLAAKLQQHTEVAQSCLDKAQASEGEVTRLQAVETSLRNQLQEYATKFEAVQDTMSKSQSLFLSFKSEMDKMTKQLQKGEKEKLELTKKLNESHQSMIQMHDERSKAATTLAKVTRQKEQLAALCKSLSSKQPKSESTADSVDA